MKKGIYKMNLSFGRMGDLEGVFVAYDLHIETLIYEGLEIYFGEVLGKHSEVYGAIPASAIKFISDDESIIKLFEDNELESGFNPLDYTTVNFDYDEYQIEEDDDYIARDLIEKIIEGRKNE